MYSFNYNLDDTDYLEFNKFHFNTSQAHKKMTLITRLMVPVALIIFFLLSLTNYETGTELLVKGAIYIVGSVIWFCVVKPLSILSIKMNMNAMKKSGKLPYGRNVQIQFDEEVIHEITEIAESKMKYSNIEKIVEVDRALYIYYAATQAFIIPISVFESEEQKNEFLRFLNIQRTS